MQEILKIVKKYGVRIRVEPNIMNNERLIDIVVEKHTKAGSIAAERKTINVIQIDECDNNINNTILRVIERMAKKINNNIKNMNTHNL